MKVEQYLTDWLQLHAAEAALKPRTIECYRDVLTRYVIPAIGAVDVDALDVLTVRHLLADIIADGHSRTAELVYVVMRAACRDIPGAPLAGLRRPVHRQRRPAPWSDDQMAVYLAALQEHRHGLALSLGLLMGLRRGEICGLRWSDVDLTANVIHICNQRLRLADGRLIDAPPKSETSVRDIPIPGPLAVQLRAARGHPAAYVCGLTPSGLAKAHRILVQRLGLPPLTLHGLRHTMATACLRHGGDMRSLQAILGHASYSTTANIYTHPDGHMLAAAIDAAAGPCYNVIQASASGCS